MSGGSVRMRTKREGFFSLALGKQITVDGLKRGYLQSHFERRVAKSRKKKGGERLSPFNLTGNGFRGAYFTTGGNSTIQPRSPVNPFQRQLTKSSQLLRTESWRRCATGKRHQGWGKDTVALLGQKGTGAQGPSIRSSRGREGSLTFPF